MQEENEILVSVVIPIYNVETYIQKCIESVLNQTWKNIEIICVNDGTQDKSMDIIHKNAEADQRIIIINISNSGQSIARNVGIERATGKYIYFLDSDDYLVEDAIEQLVNCAESNQAEVVYFNAETIFETEEIARKQGAFANYYKWCHKYPGVYNGEQLFIEMIKNWDFKPSPCLIFTNRNYMEARHLRFYPGIVHEDNLFAFQLIQKAERAVCLEKVLYKRTVRQASTMTGNKGVRNAYGFFICQREILAALNDSQYSLGFFAAVEKFLTTMRKNAANTIKNLELDYIQEELNRLDSNAGTYFLDYIYDAYMQQRKEQFVKQPKQQIQQKLRKRLRIIVNKINRIKIKMISMVPGSVRWFGRTICRFGFGYFIYRKNIKKYPGKVCVSIIIPVYNAKQYLVQNLNSLINQNLRNIEIICVDDGSTDGSKEILQEYQKKDSRIKVLYQEKTGAGAARNYGMSVAVGEYLLFLDADDIFDENLCNEAYYQSMRKKADVCLFGARRLNMQSLVTEPMNWVLRINFMPKKKVYSGQDVAKKLFQITTGCPWSKMFRRKFVLDNGLKFQNLPNSNDAYFVRLCMAVADRITFVNRCFVTYRFNEGNNTQSNKAQAPTAFHEAFKAIKTELCDRGIFDCYEQSFCNMVLKESLFNLRTAGTAEAEQKVRNLLRTEDFAYYGLQNHSADYYYDKKAYSEMKELLEGKKA